MTINIPQIWEESWIFDSFVDGSDFFLLLLAYSFSRPTHIPIPLIPVLKQNTATFENRAGDIWPHSVHRTAYQ